MSRHAHIAVVIISLSIVMAGAPASEGALPAASGSGAVLEGRPIQPAAQGVIHWSDMGPAGRSPREPSQVLSDSIPLIPMADTEQHLTPGIATRTASGLGGSTPILGLRFEAADRPDTIDELFPEGIRPPDTMGAVGPNHFMEVINNNVSIFDKATGYRLSSVLLLDFFAEVHTEDIPFDPRVLFDQHSGRWVVMAADCRCTPNFIVLAVSLTDDPTGAWFQMIWPGGGFADYPTLGVDQQAIYVAATFTDKVWAIEKAPLLADPPSAGDITEWNVFINGALHPAHTYGTLTPQYLVQTSGSSLLQIYEVQWSLGVPTLTNLGLVSVPSFSSPSDAPALQSTVPISVGSGAGSRLQMSVFRNGSLWTCHTIGQNGRGACRWYEIAPLSMSLIQSGTVAHPSLHYYYPSIMVNALGDAVMGFSGSDANQYVATYFTGRQSGAPPGLMSFPALLKEGEAPYTVLDTNGRNRWGDYSYTTLDPVEQINFWTIQEYAKLPEDIWGTWVGEISFAGFDCNENTIADAVDISSGSSDDCDANGVPDECQADCNNNLQADTCDIAEQVSSDDNSNGIPDECECPQDLDQNGAVDAQDLALLLAAWGPNPGDPADLDGDGEVGSADLALLLGSWGPCA